jgi:hypothetical protein
MDDWEGLLLPLSGIAMTLRVSHIFIADRQNRYLVAGSLR